MLKRRCIGSTPMLAVVAVGELLSIIAVNVAQSAAPGATVAAEPADAAEVREQIRHVEQLLPSIPDRAAALYFLSTAKQHMGETREALTLLRECLALHEGFDPGGSPALNALKGLKEFDDLVRAVHQAFPAVRRGRVAFVTQERDLMPEGLAYDAGRRVFYLSSLSRRKIVKITDGGVVSDFVPAGRDNLLPVLGIRVDPSDGTVWAASWSENSGKAELLHFGTSAQLLGRYAPDDTGPHGFNDLTISPKGELFLTDSVSNKVYRFDRAAGTFTSLAIYRALSAPNGIALGGQNRLLFVADDFGIIRVELDRGVSSDVNRGKSNTLAGVDGLYWRDGNLIAVQNGIGSPRIVSFRLSKDGANVEESTVLENRTTLTKTPTTGALQDNKFYFIANSQLDNMHGDDIVDLRKLEPVRIGVLDLP